MSEDEFFKETKKQNIFFPPHIFTREISYSTSGAKHVCASSDQLIRHLTLIDNMPLYVPLA